MVCVWCSCAWHYSPSEPRTALLGRAMGPCSARCYPEARAGKQRMTHSHLYLLITACSRKRTRPIVGRAAAQETGTLGMARSQPGTREPRLGTTPNSGLPHNSTSQRRSGPCVSPDRSQSKRLIGPPSRDAHNVYHVFLAVEFIYTQDARPEPGELREDYDQRPSTSVSGQMLLCRQALEHPNGAARNI
jgi:hypothetical protein